MKEKEKICCFLKKNSLFFLTVVTGEDAISHNPQKSFAHHGRFLEATPKRKRKRKKKIQLKEHDNGYSRGGPINNLKCLIWWTKSGNRFSQGRSFTFAFVSKEEEKRAIPRSWLVQHGSIPTGCFIVVVVVVLSLCTTFTTLNQIGSNKRGAPPLYQFGNADVPFSSHISHWA